MAINFNKAEFVLSAVRAETFIRDGKPQVTFAGRSNVGKSSVINLARAVGGAAKGVCLCAVRRGKGAVLQAGGSLRAISPRPWV